MAQHKHPCPSTDTADRIIPTVRRHTSRPPRKSSDARPRNQTTATSHPTYPIPRITFPARSHQISLAGKGDRGERHDHLVVKYPSCVLYLWPCRAVHWSKIRAKGDGTLVPFPLSLQGWGTNPARISRLPSGHSITSASSADGGRCRQVDLESGMVALFWFFFGYGSGVECIGTRE